MVCYHNPIKGFRCIFSGLQCIVGSTLYIVGCPITLRGQFGVALVLFMSAAMVGRACSRVALGLSAETAMVNDTVADHY